MVDIWMPWAFWATERLIRQPSPLRIATLAGFSALLCLPGHLQTSFHVFAALGLYALIRLRQERVDRRRLFELTGAGGLAIVLGIGIALIQIVPLLDLWQQPELPA